MYTLVLFPTFLVFYSLSTFSLPVLSIPISFYFNRYSFSIFRIMTEYYFVEFILFLHDLLFVAEAWLLEGSWSRTLLMFTLVNKAFEANVEIILRR